jgi:Arc/MetJ-type ribon-helix-helix transcriptional regulator
LKISYFKVIIKCILEPSKLKPLTLFLERASANYNVLKILHKDGTMTEAQKMVRLNLDLSPELNQILDGLVEKIGTSKSDVLRQAITLMQIMVIAKEETKKLGVPEANQLIVNEIILSSEQKPKPHPLDTFMERLGPWEDERTAEEIVKDIYDSRTTSNNDISL